MRDLLKDACIYLIFRLDESKGMHAFDTKFSCILYSTGQIMWVPRSIVKTSCTVCTNFLNDYEISKKTVSFVLLNSDIDNTK